MVQARPFLSPFILLAELASQNSIPTPVPLSLSRNADTSLLCPPE